MNTTNGKAIFEPKAARLPITMEAHAEQEKQILPVTGNGHALEPIQVTKTFLPPQEEYLHWLNKAWESHQLTNNGPIHKLLEGTLRDRFQVPHLRLVANGTLAIQLAIRALGIKGKVITTPYSYVATTSAILWEGCEPVYVDIKPDTLCIDPELIEAAITPDTTAILATHVYGIPCDVEAIDVIAKKHGLKVIYDAAHAFDVQYKGRSILQWGDASTLSFHATKLFHTVEGGAVVVHDEGVDGRVRFLRSFGHYGDEHFTLGINAKMSELHAAMGMAVLPYLTSLIVGRKAITNRYDKRINGTSVLRPVVPDNTTYNYAYYPILFQDERTREQVLGRMSERSVNCRRYFFPSLNALPYVVSGQMPISEKISGCVLCLPLYTGMDDFTEERVISALLDSL